MKMTNDKRNPNGEIRRGAADLSSRFGLRHSFVIRHSAFVILFWSFLTWLSFAAESLPNDYSAVDAIFGAHCLDCHAGKDPEGQLVLESFESLMKGGEIGPAIVAGNSADSLLVQMIEGRFEKEGKKKIMPPGKRAKLSAEEIATIKGWIEAGAHGPAGSLAPRELVVPSITPRL